jgi:hypothetical protein
MYNCIMYHVTCIFRHPFPAATEKGQVLLYNVKER